MGSNVWTNVLPPVSPLKLNGFLRRKNLNDEQFLHKFPPLERCLCKNVNLRYFTFEYRRDFECICVFVSRWGSLKLRGTVHQGSIIPITRFYKHVSLLIRIYVSTSFTENIVGPLEYCMQCTSHELYYMGWVGYPHYIAILINKSFLLSSRVILVGLLRIVQSERCLLRHF